jgi:hypothetical protein
VNLKDFDPRFLEWLKGRSALEQADLQSAWDDADAVPGHRNEGYARRTAVIERAKARGFAPQPLKKGRR